jgi:hypothetical protein
MAIGTVIETFRDKRAATIGKVSDKASRMNSETIIEPRIVRREKITLRGFSLSRSRNHDLG